MWQKERKNVVRLPSTESTNFFFLNLFVRKDELKATLVLCFLYDLLCNFFYNLCRYFGLWHAMLTTMTYSGYVSFFPLFVMYKIELIWWTWFILCCRKQLKSFLFIHYNRCMIGKKKMIWFLNYDCLLVFLRQTL